MEAAAAEHNQISVLRGGNETIGRLALVELEVLDRVQLLEVERFSACRDHDPHASTEPFRKCVGDRHGPSGRG